MTKVTKSVLPIALIASGAAWANPIDTQLPNAPALAGYGAYPVGVRQLEMVNADQVNILAIDPAGEKPETLPRYDRPLTVELWYPADKDATGTTELRTYLRDGTTEVTLTGRAMRDAAPAVSDVPYPLVLVSHGYPGNRFLLSHLAENLASKGYVVASIDHTDSTYRTQAAFGSTLVNRPLDQLFVLQQMANMAQEGEVFAGLYDADNTGLIGYSMGGYGAIITAGGGVTEASVAYDWGGPFGTLGIHQSGSTSHAELFDDRIKAVVAVGPWGMNRGFWDAEGLSGVKIPTLFVAGSEDDVSEYETGVRAIWENVNTVESALLTYVNAGHNAGAPMPAPKESYYFNEDKGFNISEHYSDAVWDTVRMNNILQHFTTAWLNEKLKGDVEAGSYLDLTESSNDGVWSVDEGGRPVDEHSYWKGFPEGTAKGLRFEVKRPQ